MKRVRIELDFLRDTGVEADRRSCGRKVVEVVF